MEEFFYISHDLTEEDCDGCVILSYELMMEAVHQFRIKRGGVIGCHHSHHVLPVPQMQSEDIGMRCLEYARQQNPGELGILSLRWNSFTRAHTETYRPKSYNQVARQLAAKVFRGLQVHCSVRTSAQFDELPPTRVQSVIFAQPPSKIARKNEAMDTASQKRENAEEGAVGGELCIDPDQHPMAWMRNCQHCYDDEMINFWPLLHPLTDGKGTTTQHLAHHLLSMWLWSSITHPMSCPPAPTNMEIGQWLPLDREGSREDLWIEAYTCCLQRMAQASTGWSWVTEGEGMAPQVSPWCKHSCPPLEGV